MGRRVEEGASDEAAETSLKNERGGVGERGNSRRGKKIVERGAQQAKQGKSKCSRTPRRVCTASLLGIKVRMCASGLSWVGLGSVLPTGSDKMACAMQKYSLGMGAGTADRQTDHDEKSCMYVRAGQSKSRAEQSSKKGAARSQDVQNGIGRVGEIGAQFCAWEAIPGQASETDCRLLRPP